jgi:hypothetical protein
LIERSKLLDTAGFAVTLPTHEAGDILPFTVQRGVYVPAVA